MFRNFRVLIGFILCAALVCVCAGEDCGCGGLPDASPPSGWDDPGFDTSSYSGSASSDGPGSNGAGSQADTGSSSPGASGYSGSSVSDSGGSAGGSSAGGSSDAAISLTSRAIALYNSGDFNASLVLLNSSLAFDPYSIKAWMATGDTLYALGRPDEAVAAYRHVVQLDPADGMGYTRLGDALMAAGQYNESIKSYDHAIATGPLNPGLIENRTRSESLASGISRINLSETEESNQSHLNNSVISVQVSETYRDPVSVPANTAAPGATKAAGAQDVVVIAACIVGIIIFCPGSHRK